VKDDIPLITPKPTLVPIGFSSPDRPVLVKQIELAKDSDE